MQRTIKRQQNRKRKTLASQQRHSFKFIKHQFHTKRYKLVEQVQMSTDVWYAAPQTHLQHHTLHTCRYSLRCKFATQDFFYTDKSPLHFFYIMGFLISGIIYVRQLCPILMQPAVERHEVCSLPLENILHNWRLNPE